MLVRPRGRPPNSPRCGSWGAYPFAGGTNMYVYACLHGLCAHKVLSAQLRSQLNEARHFGSRSVSPSQHFISNQRTGSSLGVPSPPGTSSPHGNGFAASRIALDTHNALSMDSPDSQMRASTGSPETRQRAGDPRMDLFFAAWDPDLPDPETLNHQFVALVARRSSDLISNPIQH